ncbi:hypothetical protein GGX14DRAFT_664802 [Mycena pura]|uniref:Uncharacterized protein n=1 Tax=Mycena pura TaxID=153505 RepID=A0AAD6Y7Z7_9AGAR|nr:hypothetical protein GGX14DRAFT_664802 [Mycena pura]
MTASSPWPWPSSSLLQLAAGANGAAPTPIIAACHRHTIIDFRFEEACLLWWRHSKCLLPTAYIVQHAHPHSHPHSLTDTSCKTRSTSHCPLHTLSAARRSLNALTSSARNVHTHTTRRSPSTPATRTTRRPPVPEKSSRLSRVFTNQDEQTDPEEMTSLQAGKTDDSYIHWQQQCPEKAFLQKEVAPLATQLARWGRLGHDRNRARFYAAEIVEGVEGLPARGPRRAHLIQHCPEAPPVDLVAVKDADAQVATLKGADEARAVMGDVSDGAEAAASAMASGGTKRKGQETSCQGTVVGRGPEPRFSERRHACAEAPAAAACEATGGGWCSVIRVWARAVGTGAKREWQQAAGRERAAHHVFSLNSASFKGGKRREWRGDGSEEESEEEEEDFKDVDVKLELETRADADELVDPLRRLRHAYPIARPHRSPPAACDLPPAARRTRPRHAQCVWDDRLERIRGVQPLSADEHLAS